MSAWDISGAIFWTITASMHWFAVWAWASKHAGKPHIEARNDPERWKAQLNAWVALGTSCLSIYCVARLLGASS